MLVGQNTAPQRRMQSAIIQALFWSLAAMVCLGLAGGLLLSRNMIRRIEMINRSAERIMQGEVMHRMPVGQANDEFDRLSENLNRMLEEIERLVGGIRAVTDNIAHDLRSPLTRLKSRLEIAMNAADRSDRAPRGHRTGDPGGRPASRHVRRAALDRRCGGGRPACRHDHRRSGWRASRMWWNFIGRWPRSAAPASISTVAGSATAQGNRQLLFQAVANLIDNAVKYGAEGQRISVEVSGGAPAPTISVADFGLGIPADEREHVLERFVRLDASRTTPGSGLGLSLVAAIARQHGATLELGDTRPGEQPPGLTARLRFPREPDERPGAALGRLINRHDQSPGVAQAIKLWPNAGPSASFRPIECREAGAALWASPALPPQL